MAIHESGFLASRHFQPLHYILIGVHDRRGLSSAVNDTWPVVKPSPEAASWVVRSPFVRVKAALPTFAALLAPPPMWARHLIVRKFTGC